MSKKTPKVVFACKFNFALNHSDRKIFYNERAAKNNIGGMFNYFSNVKKRAINMFDYFEGKINKSVLTDEYLQKDKKIKREMLKILIMRNRYPKICIISDMLDAITYGKYGSFGLKDKNGNTLNCLFGHGEAYYRNDKYLLSCMVFCPRLAEISI